MGWSEKALAVTTPCIEYFRAKFGNILTCQGGLLSPLVSLFNLTQMCDPWRVAAIQPSGEKVDQLAKVFVYLRNNSTLVDNLKAELPAYLAAASQLPEEMNIAAWWAANAKKAPSWGHLTRVLMLVMQSSAAPERVFSLMRNYIRDKQDGMLSDYLDGSLMMQYNGRDVSATRDDRRARL